MDFIYEEENVVPDYLCKKFIELLNNELENKL